MLREGGTFCAKFFKMSDLSYLQAMMKPIFRDVYVVKPESSRASSSEAFVVGIGYISTGNLQILSESLKALKSESEVIEEAKEEVQRLLLESVALRLRADVSVGIYLSGGLDSSAVAGMAARLSGCCSWAFGMSLIGESYLGV